MGVTEKHPPCLSDDEDGPSLTTSASQSWANVPKFIYDEDVDARRRPLVGSYTSCRPQQRLRLHRSLVGKRLPFPREPGRSGV